MDKMKTYKFKVYKPDGSSILVKLKWEADDPQGAIDRMYQWMERSSKLRVRRCECEWASFKMLDETA